jgi:hypothetical protein
MKIRYSIYKVKHNLPHKPCHRDGKNLVPPIKKQKSRIMGFGEDISQLSLCINVFHLYISLLYMISQEVVSHFYVLRSPMKNWVLGWAHGTRAITHEGNTLVGHSIISHGMHYLKNLGATATYSASVVDCAIEDHLRADQEIREDPRKWHVLEVLFRSIPQPMKSGSEQPTRSCNEDAE